MIEPENLHSLLVEHDKTDRDLIRYVCNGLHAYDINEIEVFPVEKKLKAECVDLKGNIDWSMEAIQELKKFDAMNRDELLELTAAIRPDPEVSICGSGGPCYR